MSIIKFRDEYGNIIELVAIRGPAGPQGIQGPQGIPGTGVTILGSYDTEAQLNAAHPTGNPGDSYLVAGYLYVWAESEGKWKNVGQIQGPQGEKGEPGTPGKDGSDGAPGSPGKDGSKGDTGNGIASIKLNSDYTLTIRYTNGASVTTSSIRGEPGPKGDTGDHGPPGNTGEPGIGIDYIEITPDYKLKVKYSNGDETTLNQSIRGPQGAKGESGSPGKDGSDGAPGVSGVHVGSDTPPASANIWINPNGRPTGTEEWAFDMDDGTTEEKTVVVLGADSASGQLAILRFKKADGTWAEIPAIAGPEGPQGPAYALTTADKAAIADLVRASLNTTTLVFTLEDGSTVSKVVYTK